MAASNASLVLQRVAAWNRANPHARLDPSAVLRVASGEGLGGGIGDRGTSFGPFQLHEGGALPSGIANPQAWAWSPAGIDYALSRIASVAGGLSGDRAVQQIVYRFERPANPAAEVARDTGGTVTGASGYQAGSLPQTPLSPTDAGAPDALLAQLLLQNGGQFPQAKTIGASFKNPVVKVNGKPPADLTNALTVAKKYLAASKGAFSNAGFAQYVHGLHSGARLPSSAAGQFRATRPTSSPKAGDLVFGTRGRVTHSGVMVDSQTYLHGGGGTLRVSNLGDQSTAGLVSVRTVDGAGPIA